MISQATVSARALIGRSAVPWRGTKLRDVPGTARRIPSSRWLSSNNVERNGIVKSPLAVRTQTSPRLSGTWAGCGVAESTKLGISENSGRDVETEPVGAAAANDIDADDSPAAGDQIIATRLRRSELSMRAVG
jgi:hypothetical protein